MSEQKNWRDGVKTEIRTKMSFLYLVVLGINLRNLPSLII